MLRIAEPGERTASAFLERAGTRTGEAGARRHHDRTGNRICRIASNQELVHVTRLHYRSLTTRGGLKIATREGKGADCCPSPNLNRPRTNRISAARWYTQ